VNRGKLPTAFRRVRFTAALSAGLLFGSAGSSLAAPAAASESARIEFRDSREILGTLTVDLRIPIFSGIRDVAFQSHLNEEIVGTIEHAVREMKEQYARDESDVKKGSLPSWNHELYARATVTFNEAGILSFYLEIYRFTGGAHGMIERKQYNVDLQNSRFLSLGDLFEKDFDYVRSINAEVEKRISLRPGEFFREKSMGFETILPDQPFFIGREGIVVYFAPYQIAPYSTGFPEFVIPLGVLPIVPWLLRGGK